MLISHSETHSESVFVSLFPISWLYMQISRFPIPWLSWGLGVDIFGPHEPPTQVKSNCKEMYSNAPWATCKTVSLLVPECVTECWQTQLWAIENGRTFFSLFSFYQGVNSTKQERIALFLGQRHEGSTERQESSSRVLSGAGSNVHRAFGQLIFNFCTRPRASTSSAPGLMIKENVVKLLSIIHYHQI